MKRFKKLLLVAVILGALTAISTSFTGCYPITQTTQSSSDSVNTYWNGYWKAFYLNADYKPILDDIRSDYLDSLATEQQDCQRDITLLKQRIDSLKNSPDHIQDVVDSLELVYNKKLNIANDLANNYWKNYYALLNIDTVYISTIDTVFKIKHDTIHVTKLDTLWKIQTDTMYMSTLDTLWKTRIDTIYRNTTIEITDTLWRTVHDTLYLPLIDTVYQTDNSIIPLKYANRDISMDSIRIILAPVYLNKAVNFENNYFYKKSGDMVNKYNFITDSLLIYQLGSPVKKAVQLHPVGTTESDTHTNSVGVVYSGAGTIDGITSAPCQYNMSADSCHKEGRYTSPGYPHWIEYSFDNTYQFTNFNINVYYSEKNYVHGIRLYADGELVDSFITSPTTVGGDIWTHHKVNFKARKIRMEVYDLGSELPEGMLQNNYTDIWEVQFFGLSAVPNSSTQKSLPATIIGATATANASTAFYVTDDITSENYTDINVGRWAAQPMPQSLTLELAETDNVVAVHTNFYDWDKGRIYTYNIDTSPDGVIWGRVKDSVKSSAAAWTIDTFGATPAKYVRLTLLSNNIVNSEGKPNLWANVWEIKVFKQQ